MTILISAAAAFCGIATLIHLLGIVVAARRCRPPRHPLAPAPDAPPVSVIRPVCGIDNFVEDTLASTFRLDHPRYEVIFCVALERDPIVPMVRADRRTPTLSCASAGRRRPGERQSQAQQLRQGLGRGRP
jgi:ceramide glucosyltransferase